LSPLSGKVAQNDRSSTGKRLWDNKFENGAVEASVFLVRRIR
jgi:ribosomal protein L27